MIETLTILLLLLFVAAGSADISKVKRFIVCGLTLLGVIFFQSMAHASLIDMPRSTYYSSDMTPFYEDIIEEYTKAKNHLNIKDEHLDNHVVKAIAQAAKDAGVDPNFLATVANIESSMDPKARNNRVKGLFQFTPGTWRMMVKRHAKRYGIKKPDIYNPYHNALMAAELMKDNSEWMHQKLKRNMRDHEVYMAHFISPLYGVRMLRAKGMRAAVDVVPASFVAENKSLFYRKGAAMTVRQFIANMKAKVSDKYFEVTNPDEPMLASIDVCNITVRDGSVSSVSTRNDVRCAYNQSGDWWDRHISSVLAV